MSRQKTILEKSIGGEGSELGRRAVTRTLGPVQPPHLPAPCLAAASRPHSRTPWSAGMRSSAVVSVPPSNQAGNGGRRGPKVRRGRSPPLAVGGPRLGCTGTRRSESGIDRMASGSAPLRPFQSEDSGEFSVYLRSRAPGTVAHCGAEKHRPLASGGKS